MKKLKYDAVAYVQKYGNPHHKLQMLILLGGSTENRQKLVRELKALQNLDGGWPWQSKKDNPSGIAQTARTTVLLLKAGETKDSDTLKAAMSFLLRMQNPDGGWSENPELEGIVPKEWGWISTKYSGFQTADVISALVGAGYSKDERTKRAVHFLLRTQNEEGGWPSYVGPDYPYEGSDIAAMDHIVVALLKVGQPKNSPVFRNAVGALLKHRDDWKEPVGASSVLNVLLMLGYSLEHEYVKELITNIIETQRSDGGWNWFGDLPSNSGQTLESLEQLVKCGVYITGAEALL